MGHIVVNEDGTMKKRESFLSYGQQWITNEDIEAVVAVLKSSFLTQGPKIQEFERKVADYVGTAALHGACFAAGIVKEMKL